MCGDGKCCHINALFNVLLLPDHITSRAGWVIYAGIFEITAQLGGSGCVRGGECHETRTAAPPPPRVRDICVVVHIYGHVKLLFRQSFCFSITIKACACECVRFCWLIYVSCTSSLEGMLKP